MTTRRKAQATDTEKALVSVPPPRRPSNIYLIGDGTEAEFRVNPAKRERQATFYEMYRQHPTLRAAIEKIAKTAVANGYRFIPSEPNDEVPDDRLRTLKTFMRRSNANQLLRLTYKDLLIYGEAYWLIIGAVAHRPVQAKRLHPMYMDARIVRGELAGWRYGPMHDSDDAIQYETGEIVQFKMDDPNSDVYGLSLLDSLQHTVASDLFAMRFNKKFFENSASSGLILSMKNATKEEVDRNREWLDQNYVGTENAHRPMILEGEITVEHAAQVMKDMQFIEGRKFNRQEILSVLDIDPTKLGINEDANRSTSKEADNSFRQESIVTLQVIVEEEISNALILGMFGYDDILFEQEESSMRDKLAVMEMFADGERMGVFSINDILRAIGRPTVTGEGGETHFVQTAAGLIPLSLLDNVAERLVVAPQVMGGPGLGTDNPPGGTPEDNKQ